MHQSATDIASFTTGRATILIGPRGAFGVQKQHLLLKDASRIRAVLQQLFSAGNYTMMVRPYIIRWGLDQSVLTRADRSVLVRWLTDKAVIGAIGIIVVPDPVTAFAGLVEHQEATATTLKGSTALEVDTDPATMLPAGLPDRFLILMSMVPDYMEGAVKQKFLDMIDSVGLETIAVGLLIWIGAHFVPGLNLVVLAFDLFMLSGEVMRAIETVAKSIDNVGYARTRADLIPIAKVLAGAIAVLIVNGVLNRFLKAKKLPRGQSKSLSGRTKKRSRKTNSGSGTAGRAGSRRSSSKTSQRNAETGSQGGPGAAGGEKSAAKPPKIKSKRLQYMGRTPGKKSRTGRQVQDRMRAEGTLRGKGKNARFKASNGKWYPLDKADMAHNKDAVKYWNETGRKQGAKSPEVRKWMLDPDNYTLDHYSINRSSGARLPDRYMPPIE